MDGSGQDCQTHRSTYPSIVNRFPVIQSVSSKVRHFSTFFAHFGLPGTIAVNVTWMEKGFNAGQTHHSMYPSIFDRLRAIPDIGRKLQLFPIPLAFNAPVGGVPIGIPGKVWTSEN